METDDGPVDSLPTDHYRASPRHGTRHWLVQAYHHQNAGTIADHRTAVLEETRGFLQKVYGGSIGLMMHAMVEENALSQEELDQLYTILQKAEEGSTHER